MSFGDLDAEFNSETTVKEYLTNALSSWIRVVDDAKSQLEALSIDPDRLVRIAQQENVSDLPNWADSASKPGHAVYRHLHPAEGITVADALKNAQDYDSARRQYPATLNSLLDAVIRASDTIVNQKLNIQLPSQSTTLRQWIESAMVTSEMWTQLLDYLDIREAATSLGTTFLRRANFATGRSEVSEAPGEPSTVRRVITAITPSVFRSAPSTTGVSEEPEESINLLNVLRTTISATDLVSIGLASFFRAPNAQAPNVDNDSLIVWRRVDNAIESHEISQSDKSPVSVSNVLVASHQNGELTTFQGDSSVGGQFATYTGIQGADLDDSAAYNVYIKYLAVLNELLTGSTQINAEPQFISQFGHGTLIAKLQAIQSFGIDSGRFTQFIKFQKSLNALSSDNFFDVIPASGPVTTPTQSENPERRVGTRDRIQLLLGAFYELRRVNSGYRADGAGTIVNPVMDVSAPLTLLFEAVRLFGDGSPDSNQAMGQVLLGLVMLRGMSVFQYEPGDIVYHRTSDTLYRVDSYTKKWVLKDDVADTAEAKRDPSSYELVDVEDPGDQDNIWAAPIGASSDKDYGVRISGNQIEDIVNPISGPSVELDRSELVLYRDVSQDAPGKAIPIFGMDKTTFDNIRAMMRARNIFTDKDASSGHMVHQTTATSDDLNPNWDQIDPTSSELTEEDRATYAKGNLMRRIQQAMRATIALNILTTILVACLEYVMRVLNETVDPLIMRGGHQLATFTGGIGSIAIAAFGTATVAVLGALYNYLSSTPPSRRINHYIDPVTFPLFFRRALRLDHMYLAKNAELVPHIRKLTVSGTDTALIITNSIRERGSPRNAHESYAVQLLGTPLGEPLQRIWRVPEYVHARAVAENMSGAMMVDIFSAPTNFLTNTDHNTLLVQLEQYLATTTESIQTYKDAMIETAGTLVKVKDARATIQSEQLIIQFGKIVQALASSNVDGALETAKSFSDDQMVKFLNWIRVGRLLLNLDPSGSIPVFDAAAVQHFGMDWNNNLDSKQIVDALYKGVLQILCAHLGLSHALDSVPGVPDAHQIVLTVDRGNAMQILNQMHAMGLVPDTIDLEGLVSQIKADEHAATKQTMLEHLFAWHASLTSNRALTDFSTAYVLICRAFQHTISTYLDTVVKCPDGDFLVTHLDISRVNSNMFSGGGTGDDEGGGGGGGGGAGGVYRDHTGNMARHNGADAPSQTAAEAAAERDEEGKEEEKEEEETKTSNSGGLANMLSNALNNFTGDSTEPPAAPLENAPPEATLEVTPTIKPFTRAEKEITDRLVSQYPPEPDHPTKERYTIQFRTVSPTDPNIRMYESVARFKHFKIAQQLLDSNPFQNTASTRSWLWQISPVEGRRYEDVTHAQLTEYVAEQSPYPDKTKPWTMPTILGLDNEAHFACPYNYSVNVLRQPRGLLASKVLSKLSVVDLFAYRDIYLDPARLRRILQSYKEGRDNNIMSRDSSVTSTVALHAQLNATMMHTAPDNIPVIYRADLERLFEGLRSLVTRDVAKGTIRLDVKLASDFQQMLAKQERTAASIFNPSGSQHRVGTDGRPISLTVAARMLVERVTQTAISGSYEPTVNEIQFQGGATHPGFQSSAIAAELGKLPDPQFVDADQGKLFSMKLYHLFAEMAEAMPAIHPETLLFVFPEYRMGKAGFARNKAKKTELIQAYLALQTPQSQAIDQLTATLGLPLLRDSKTGKARIAAMEAMDLQSKPSQSMPVVPKLQALLDKLVKYETQKRDQSTSDKRRKLAGRRLEALEQARDANFTASSLTVPPYNLPGAKDKWQRYLWRWKNPDTGKNYFTRKCSGVPGIKGSYCVWEPVDGTEDANSQIQPAQVLKSKTDKKVLESNMGQTKPVYGATVNRRQTGIGVNPTGSSSKTTDAATRQKEERARLELESKHLARAKHEEIVRRQPEDYMDGNRGKGAVRVFTARDAAGNEVFTVLPHNLIANIMILVYSALIIYAGSRGAVAFRALYLVQTKNRTTKLEAVYPARGAATFFFGFGFGTIVAFLASIVEFFNYWRFRYVFGLLLMALPIIVLGSIGMSNLNNENSLLSEALNPDPSGVDITVSSEDDPPDPGHISSLLGTEYQDELTDARESLAISDMLFIGLGIGVLVSGVMIGIPGGPFHTDRNEMAVKKLRDGGNATGSSFKHSQHSHIKTAWIVYPALLTVAVIGAGAASIAVGTEGGPEIKRTSAEVDEDERVTSVDKNVAWPAIQGSIIAMAAAVLLFGGLVLVGYLRQRHTASVASGQRIERRLRERSTPAQAQPRFGYSTRPTARLGQR